MTKLHDLEVAMAYALRAVDRAEEEAVIAAGTLREKEKDVEIARAAAEDAKELYEAEKHEEQYA